MATSDKYTKLAKALRDDAAGWRKAAGHPHHESYADRIMITVGLLESAAEAIAAANNALSAISAIRDDIIGRQALGWSRHVYPLVEWLGAAGYPGVGFGVARKMVTSEEQCGPSVDRSASKEAIAASAVRLIEAIPIALGQLRHLYEHMVNDRVVDLRSAADGLLAPAIRRIETALAPPTPRAAEPTP